VTKAEMHRYSFKTPTILNRELKVPYTHHEVYKTLEDVVHFYNEGGVKGLGFKLPIQNMLQDKMNLTALEKKQLIIFMKTLTDDVYEK
jgi:cytochrome c peroxidase